MRGTTWVAILLGLVLAGQIALHLLEPPLAITWSFGHLGRHPGLWWTGVALVATLPVAVHVLWAHPALAAPLRPSGWLAPLALGALLGGALVWAGLAHPMPGFSPDAVFFEDAVSDPSFVFIPRWYLTAWSFGQVARLAGRGTALVTIIRCTNAVVMAVALLALVGSARQVGRTRGEALALTALAWTAFGTLQPALGYVDVYPTVIALMALYLWTGLRTLAGGHPAWPLAIGAMGPFWYIGLVLLVPSMLVLAGRELVRGGARRLAVGLAAALVVAGLATVPGYDAPFAWGGFARAVAAWSNVAKGLSPTSALLPPGVMLSAAHAREVLHLLLLIDGVGCALLATAGTWLARARGAWDWPAAFLAVVLLPGLAYLVAMDPIFGAFSDWDLFCYLAPVTSVAGGYAFVRWGRARPRLFPGLLGLALAAAGIHLLARLNALDVDIVRHRLESPVHEQPPAPAPRPPRRSPASVTGHPS